MQPEILATFVEILPEHGDLEEYLQAIAARDAGITAQITSFIDASPQTTPVRTPANEHNIQPRSLSRVNRLDDQVATLTEPSVPETVSTESRGLPKELIDSFPVQKLKAKSGWFSSKKADPERCSICVTEFKVGRSLLTLPCLHLYHKRCIEQWLENNKTCPICNTDLSIAQA